MHGVGRPEKPLPVSADSLSELARELRWLRGQADLTVRMLADRTGLAISTLTTAAAGRRLPSWSVTRAFAIACGTDVPGTDLQRVRELWERACEAAGRPVPDQDWSSAEPPDPDQAADAAQLLYLMRLLRVWAGSPSLAEVNARSGGYHLPPSTVSQVLRRRGLPRRALVSAYVRACGLDDAQVGRWEEAWDRLRASQERAAAAPRLSVALSRQDTGHAPGDDAPPMFECDDLGIYRGAAKVLEAARLVIEPNSVTALMGPYGSGGQALLRALHRVNGSGAGFRVEGKILFRGEDLYGYDVDLSELRRRIGMVAARPDLLPTSIYDNAVAGLSRGKRPRPRRTALDDACEQALRNVQLWNTVKHRLHQSALSLSPSQQRLLCIARALATRPEALLMDEPCSTATPIQALAIEDLIVNLASDTAVVIVPTNMQLAARVAHTTAFFTTVNVGLDPDRYYGRLVEYGPTGKIFTNPVSRTTEDYISGRFG